MFLKSKILNQFPELIHGFTTRELGSDYERISQALGLSSSSIFTLKQVHSNRVVPIFHPSPVKGRGPNGALRPNPLPFRHYCSGGQAREGDALVTRIRGLVIGIRTADCVPILVYDPERKAIAAIHAGWRGLISGVIENAVTEMREKFQSKPDLLIVALGPALCIDCFEVGPEVAEKFLGKFGERIKLKKGKGDRAHPDLRE